MASSYLLAPCGRLTGSVTVPGDKSISHRALLLAAIAVGQTRIYGLLQGEDSLATLCALRELGVNIRLDAQCCIVDGVGLHGLCAPAGPLDMGNAGTGMRLLAGVLAGQRFDTVLCGDASLSARPMGRIITPLTMMGARIEAENDTAPLLIRGGQTLVGIDYKLPVASAQLKSCLLLAGLYAQGRTTLLEVAVSRDHTERMLQAFGCPVTSTGGGLSITAGSVLSAADVVVPGDLSSAAFLMVAATITPGSELLIRGVGVNPTRVGVITILKAMGADIVLLNPRSLAGEPVADIRVSHARLSGITIPAALVPLAIDEFPVIFIAAACAQGETQLTGAAELRVKESDRLAAMASGLTALGIKVSLLADGIIIDGGRLAGGRVDSCGDHRVAMAFSVAACVASGDVIVDDCANVATSFPGFAELLTRIGADIKQS